MATVNMSYPRSIRLTTKSKVLSTKPMPEGSWTSKRSINEENETSQPTKKLRIVPLREKVSFKDSFKGPFMVTLKLPSHVLQAEAEQALHRKQRRDLIKQGWRNLGMRRYHWSKGQLWQVFFLFSLLPVNIRLQIWSLLNPDPHMLIQGKLLTHRPMATFMEPRKTPVVLQVCRESRYEYLYRENDDANQVTTRSHNLYGQYFQDMNGKMVYFSFEVDELWLMNFRVAEPLVRANLKTIVLGPRQSTRLPCYYPYRSSGHMRGGYRLAPNHVIDDCGCMVQQLSTNKHSDYRYNFKDLRYFPSLQKLVVLMEKTHLDNEEQRKKIMKKVDRAIEVARKTFPCINMLEVEYRVGPTQHTCQAHGPP